ncbi:DUF952 domain-containing protein [Sanguibacter massiliensis]|uniref:DUF952 domain-containing protein n=1 Tax=Sanguibacter massiliensis TaxID=1973217 RepID=UPI000C8154FC|nr:DUF952 domain-containing protein [Sanguibacter massiliensis]
MSLFHIAEIQDWQSAQESGAYVRSTRGASLAEVGFVHCSLRDQVGRVGTFIYADGGAGELVVLELDDARVAASGADVRLEDGGTGELFPHVYGPLDPAWVVEVHPVRAGGGSFFWGAEAG